MRLVDGHTMALWNWAPTSSSRRRDSHKLEGILKGLTPTSLFYWWENRPRKIVSCPGLCNLSSGSMHRFPDFIFRMSATKQVGPFAVWTLTFQIAFSTGWLVWAAPCRLIGWLLEQAKRKRRWKVSRYLLEGLFSSVGSDVVVEGGGPGKGTTTVAALERPVTGVSDHVVPQFWRLGKGLGAVTALVRSEINRETAWSWFSMLVSGSQHREAKAQGFGDIACSA